MENLRIKNTIINTVAAMSCRWRYFCKCSFGFFDNFKWPILAIIVLEEVLHLGSRPSGQLSVYNPRLRLTVPHIFCLCLTLIITNPNKLSSKIIQDTHILFMNVFISVAIKYVLHTYWLKTVQGGSPLKNTNRINILVVVFSLKSPLQMKMWWMFF